MNKEEKINKIIDIMNLHIRGAGDYEGVKNKVDFYMEKYLLPIITPTFKILDVGAGDCFTADYLKDKVAYWEGINKGIDWENNKEKYNIKNSDFNFMDYKSNSFDLLISVSTLEHSYFPLMMLAEMNRISKKYIYVQLPAPERESGIPYDDHPDHYFVLSRKGWINIFKKFNLKILKNGTDGAEYQFLLEKTKDWY